MLILASASPRRRDLLTAHGFDFQIAPADVTEIAPIHFTAREIVLFNARLKSAAVASLHPQSVVLGVDTLVAFKEKIFGKPANFAEAEAMLSELNGQTHEVYSGVCLKQAGREHSFVEVTQVHFRTLNLEARRAYLQRIGPLDKAGAYAAQDDNGELIARIEGSMSNVIGLPMEALTNALNQFHL